MIKTIKPQVSDRLIKELPRFFAGWERTLSEIFQNAYRAGATRIDIDSNANGSRLVIADNGRGCDDPQLLLTAGGTGWDENTIVEPAGLGFYSLLNPQLVIRLKVESKDWLVSFETAHYENETPVEEGKGFDGFRLSLDLKEAHQWLKDEVAKARAYYPFAVTLNGEVIEPHPLSAECALRTSAGDVYVRFGSSFTRKATLLWDYAVLDGSAFCDKLHKAAQSHAHASLARRVVEAALCGEMVWQIDANSGARPRLPDRDALIDNAQLDAAAQTIVNALVDYVIEHGRPAIESLPDVFEVFPKWTVDWLNILDASLATFFGWERYECDDVSEICAYEDDDSLSLESPSSIHYWIKKRPGVLTVDEADFRTLAHLRVYQIKTLPPVRIAAQGEPSIPITFKGKIKPSGHVGWAEKILWNGIELPYYLVPMDGTYNQDFEKKCRSAESVAVVVSGDIRTATRSVLEDEVGGHAIEFVHETDSLWNCDWVERDEDGYELQWGEIHRSLKMDVAEILASKKMVAQRALLAKIEDHLAMIPDRGFVYSPLGKSPKSSEKILPIKTGRVALDKSIARFVAARQLLFEAAGKEIGRLEIEVGDVEAHGEKT